MGVLVSCTIGRISYRTSVLYVFVFIEVITECVQVVSNAKQQAVLMRQCLICMRLWTERSDEVFSVQSSVGVYADECWQTTRLQWTQTTDDKSSSAERH